MVLKVRNKDVELNAQRPIDGPSVGIAISLALIIALSMFAIAFLAIAIF